MCTAPFYVMENFVSIIMFVFFRVGERFLYRRQRNVFYGCLTLAARFRRNQEAHTYADSGRYEPAEFLNRS